MVEREVESSGVDPRVARTRERVLAAAQGLLLSSGLESVTHLEVARRSGVGRRTLYRHWPARVDLLQDALASADFPHAEPTGALRDDLVAHLRALRRALDEGPLAYVVHALGERAAVDPALVELRDRLTERGCAPARDLLRDAMRRGELPADVDVAAAAAALEGPLFHRALVRHERIPAADPEAVADDVLALVAAGRLRRRARATSGGGLSRTSRR